MSCGWMWPNVDIDCGYDDSFVAVAVVCGCGWSVNMFDGMNDLWLDGVECGHRPMGMGMMILCWCGCGGSVYVFDGITCGQMESNVDID